MMAIPGYVLVAILVLVVLLGLAEWVGKGWSTFSRVVFALCLLGLVLYLTM